MSEVAKKKTAEVVKIDQSIFEVDAGLGNSEVNSEVLSMLMSGAVSSRDLGPGAITKKKKKNSTKKGKYIRKGKPNRKSKRGKPKKS